MRQQRSTGTPTSEESPYGGRLMFTQSWEDPACDIEWLDLEPGNTLFTITSGGDNVLDFLLEDPGRVVSVDINPLQTHLAELKLAAFRTLSHEELLNLVGVRVDLDAVELYGRLRGVLGQQARRYWDANTDMLASGLLKRGGFERYFAILRRVLRVLVGRRKLERLFTLEPHEQPTFFQREWNTLRWRTFLRVGCSKWFLGNRLDPSWFAHDDGPASYGDHFGGLARHAISEIPAHTNYFLAQIFLGRYVSEDVMPRYLLEEHFDTIRARLDRIEWVTADVYEALTRLPDDSVDAFALSNVFEYSPPDLFEAAKEELTRVARPGAPITLRNLLAPRRLGEDPRFVDDVETGDRLRRADRGFIYAHFEATRYARP